MTTPTTPPSTASAFGWHPTQDGNYWGARSYQKIANGNMLPFTTSGTGQVSENADYTKFEALNLGDIQNNPAFDKGAKWGKIDLVLKIVAYLPTPLSIVVGVYHIVSAHKNDLENKWTHTIRGVAECFMVLGVALMVVDAVASASAYFSNLAPACTAPNS